MLGSEYSQVWRAVSKTLLFLRRVYRVCGSRSTMFPRSSQAVTCLRIVKNSPAPGRDRDCVLRASVPAIFSRQNKPPLARTVFFFLRLGDHIAGQMHSAGHEHHCRAHAGALMRSVLIAREPIPVNRRVAIP